ncbi:MAG: TonB-dependent receptor [Minicystis sp.]
MKRLSFSLAALILASSGRAAAQAPPEDAPTTNALPRGAGGAVLKPQDKAPADAGKAPDVTMPRPRNYTPPAYPPEAEKAGLEAQVTLTLDIDKQGKVTKAVVAEPAGHGFDEAALEAARKLEFEPARKADGTPFAARIRYRYSFTLTRAPAQAQKEQKSTAVLSGAVLASGGDVAIAGAKVVLGPGNIETTTDEKGAFTFPDLAPGKYTISVRAPGYQGLDVAEEVSAGEATEVKYRLLPSGGALEVSVRGDRPPREVVKRTLEQREIARIPGTNGDALKSLQSLPGVARPPGVLGVLIVRGSAPQDTQTFIDGTPVPLIYHFGGLSSVVPTEVLEKIDFYPGNFSTEYGRVQGGIVDVGLRNPRSEYHGLAQIDLIDARLMFEGPIPGLKGWNFLAAGRRSYVDAWLGPTLKAAGAGVTQAPVYYDYQFMVATNPTPDSSFRVAFFGSDDALKLLIDTPAGNDPGLTGNVGLHTAFMRLQTRYQNNLPNGDKINAVISFNRDNIDFGLSSLYFLLDVRSVSGRFEYTKKLTKGMILDAGIDMQAGYYDVNVRLPAPPAPGQPPQGPFSTRAPTEQHLRGAAYQPAAYAEMEISPDPRVRVVPGVRLDYFGITKEYTFSPRVNARFDIKKEFPRSTVKGGVGLFHQPPQFQEVSTAFGNPKLKSNRSIQYSLGFEQELTRQVTASVEGFYKQLDGLVVGSASPSGASIEYGNTGTGWVVGSELLLKYKPDSRFFGWLAYTISRSVRRDSPDAAERLVPFDQTHILTVLGSYRLGNGWEIGARFRLVSGNLVSPYVCNPLSSTCDPARTNALFNGGSGTYVPIPLGGPASERLPLFHQLDIRVDKQWKFKRWQLSAYLDVQNAYNQANIEAIGYNFNFTGRSYVAGLPILPSIGVRGEF